MAIALQVPHIDGLRLRQQRAQQIVFSEGEKGGIPLTTPSTEWIFESDDCPRDMNPKLRDMKGNLVPADTYTVHVTANLRNLVIEKKGAPADVPFRNASVRNQMRIKNQHMAETGKKDKTGKPIKDWVTVRQEYVPANTFFGVRVGEGVRAIVDEMPT